MRDSKLGRVGETRIKSGLVLVTMRAFEPLGSTGILVWKVGGMDWVWGSINKTEISHSMLVISQLGCVLANNAVLCWPGPGLVYDCRERQSAEQAVFHFLRPHKKLVGIPRRKRSQ